MKTRTNSIFILLFVLVNALCSTGWALGWPKATWERLEIIGAGIVVLAVFGEYLHQFAEWPKDPTTKERFGRWSTIILILGLQLELFGLVKSTVISNSENAQVLLRVEELRQKNDGLEAQLDQVHSDQLPRATKLSIAFLSKTGGLQAALKASAPGQALIWYFPNDMEAEGFAREIWAELNGAGWKIVSDIMPIPSNVPLVEAAEMRRAEEAKINGFTLVPINGSVGLLIATSDGRDWGKPPTTPAKALLDGLLECGFAVNGGGNSNPLAPANTVLIVIGQK